MSGGQVADTRVDFSGDIGTVLERACEKFSLGVLKKYSPIDVGYEDYNIILEAEAGKYFVKIFASKRTKEDIARYVSVIEKVIYAGVNHPTLLEHDGGHLYVDVEADISMIIMDYIEGRSLYDLGIMLNRNNLKVLLEQTVLINKMDFKPPFVEDSWSIQNNDKSLEVVREYLDKEDLSRVNEVLDEMRTLNTESLPHCFVHGDLIAPNLIMDKTGKMYIVDFSVSNWYPRIQELAVIVSSGLDKVDLNFESALVMMVEEYRRAGGDLSDEEISKLALYTRAAFAAELLSAYREKYINGNNSLENEHWIKLGRDGLLWALAG